MRALFVFAALAACGLATACGARDDVTPLIPVQPGAAARAMALLGHGGPNDPHAAEVAADAGDDDTGEVEPGRIAFSCMEARGAMKALARVPCKVTIAPIEADAGGAPTEILFETGRVSVDAPPGKYRVTASRGPEFGLSTWDAEVVSGEVAWGPGEGATVLGRVVDTRGYLALDLDPAAATEQRVFADAAAGVEIVRSDATPILQGAKLDDAVAPFDAGDLDVVEAWSDRDAFLARIASKHPATGIASAPARTYVRVDDDGPLSTWSPIREADLARGLGERRDVVLTTGPFLRVTANGAPIGGVARPSAEKDVEVKVHVECAPWVTVDRVSIARASGAPVESRSVTLHPTATDARAADVSFVVHVTTDDAFVVLADSAATRAMTGAIWIDADGDGESLGRRAPAPEIRKPDRPKPAPAPPPKKDSKR